MVIEWIFILILVVCVLFLIMYLVHMKGTIESRARDLFSSWRTLEQEDTRKWKEEELPRISREKAGILFDEWRAREEEGIRTDAVKRSHAVTRGKITEHLIPYFPGFPYNPKDARFLGSPVDLIVFDGLSDEKIQKIVFVEIKASRNPVLSKREREVRDCIDEKRVEYRMLQQDPGEDPPGTGPDSPR
jgi:predicted Holliday junction resolvase-like endonuclease